MNTIIANGGSGEAGANCRLYAPIVTSLGHNLADDDTFADCDIGAVEYAAVPEPSSGLLRAAALGCLGRLRPRRRE